MGSVTEDGSDCASRIDGSRLEGTQLIERFFETTPECHARAMGARRRGRVATTTTVAVVLLLVFAGCAGLTGTDNVETPTSELPTETTTAGSPATTTTPPVTSTTTTATTTMPEVLENVTSDLSDETSRQLENRYYGDRDLNETELTILNAVDAFEGEDKERLAREALEAGATEETARYLELAAYAHENDLSGSLERDVLSHADQPLEDPDGDELPNYMEEFLETDASASNQELGEVLWQLSENGEITGNEIEFLEQVSENSGECYSTVKQLKQAGLLEQIIEDGQITDEELDISEDSDNDNMADGFEKEELGTDPNRKDTDRDGFHDGIEATQALEGVNLHPTEMDAVVEIDYEEGVDPAELNETTQRISQRAANSPIDNGTGLHLHFIIDEELEEMDKFYGSTGEQIAEEHFDRNGKGVHYQIVVDDETQMANLGERFAPHTSVAKNKPGVISHELYHSLGIGGDQTSDFEYVDNSDVSIEEAPSVMNYNSPMDWVRLTDEEWLQIEKRIEAGSYDPGNSLGGVPDNSNLNMSSADCSGEFASADD